MFDFTGKTVLITGASGGVGRGLCEAFTKWGANVIALDLDAAGLEALSAEGICQQTGVCDLTDRHRVAELVTQLAPSTGIDILINNAGGGAATALATLTPELWDRDIAVNLTAAYNCVEAVKGAMIRRGHGAIVNIGTVNAFLALGHPAYSAAKAGLVSFTKSMAVEWGQYGIRVNMVAPGTVKTGAWKDRVAQKPEIFESLKRWYPLRDFADPQDIANACAFLAGDAARMITGAILPVDAGLTAGNLVLAAELTLESF